MKHFQRLNMWGGTAGNWGKRSLDPDEIEIMVVARKTVEPLAAGNPGKSCAGDTWQSSRRTCLKN